MSEEQLNILYEPRCVKMTHINSCVTNRDAPATSLKCNVKSLGKFLNEICHVNADGGSVNLECALK